MKWYEDQEVVIEGLDISFVTNTIQVWLPITFSTGSIAPPHQNKLFVTLTGAQAALISDENSAVVVQNRVLTADDKNGLKLALNNIANFDVGTFVNIIAVAGKLILPAGWVGVAISYAVKSLVGFLLNQAALRMKVSELSALVEVGGVLSESWHKVQIATGQVFFYRTISYDVTVGTNKRTFVLQESRYAMKI
jgi:hypothetical protein